MNDPLTRAYYAYFYSCLKEGKPTVFPDPSLSAQEEFNTKPYVSLRDTHGNLIAIYRMRANGYLRRLSRWPIPMEHPPLPKSQLFKRIKGGLTSLDS
jgi:hypothetical protein